MIVFLFLINILINSCLNAAGGSSATASSAAGAAGGAASAEASSGLFELPEATLKARPVCIPFEAKEVPHLLVRTTREDLAGFRQKDEKKSPVERGVFGAQFALISSIPLMGLYDKAAKEAPAKFNAYQFGLFSIYALEGEKGCFVGELNLTDSDISSAGFSEITIDIHPDARGKGIGTAATHTAIEHIIKPNLGKKVSAISIADIRADRLDSAFKITTKKLTQLKSKVAFDNIASLKINEKLGLSMWGLTEGYEITFMYPPSDPGLSPEALTLLLSPHKEERRAIIATLRDMVDSMKSGSL